jgi:hypothetical protein
MLSIDVRLHPERGLVQHGGGMVVARPGPGPFTHGRPLIGRSDGTRRYFEAGKPQHGLRCRRATHLLRRLKAAAACRSFGFTEDCATVFGR